MPFITSRPVAKNSSHSLSETDLNQSKGQPFQPSPTKKLGSMQQRRRSSTIRHALSSLLGGANVHSPAVLNNTTKGGNNNGNIRSSNTDAQLLGKKQNKQPLPNARRHSTTAIQGSISDSATTTPRSSTSDTNRRTSGRLSVDQEPRISGGRYSQIEEDSTVLDFDDDHNSSAVVSSDLSSTSLTRLANSKKFNEQFLIEYLTARGLLGPKTVLSNEYLKISISTSGESVFLPTISSNDDEYLSRLNGLNDGTDDAEADFFMDGIDQQEGNTPSLATTAAATESGGSINENRDTLLRENNSGDHPGSGSELNTRSVEIDSSMVSYSIAVIVSVKKPTRFTDMQLELCSRVKVFWNTGVPPTKTFNEEFYNAASMKWNLNDENFDLFVPLSISPDDQMIENNSNDRQMRLFKNIPTEERLYLDKTKTKASLLNAIDVNKTHLYQPGDYVFLVPVVFSNHIPETIYLPSARVSYRLRLATKAINRKGFYRQDSNSPQPIVSPDSSSSLSSTTSSLKLTETESAQAHRRISNTLFSKVKNHLHMSSHQLKNEESGEEDIFAEYPIKVIRTPPPVAVSTANKPIYINRVWTDSLSYEISFAQKYVSLNSEVPIKIKLAPICKNVCVKRIHVSITERVTFVSKGYEYEYDQTDPVAKDPYNPYYLDFASKRRKERSVSLFEIRTKEKGTRALREEIVENSFNDNLLSYSPFDDDSDSKGNPKERLGITEPIIIETKLKFPKYEDLDKRTAKIIPPYGIDTYTSIPNPEHAVANGPSHRRPSVIGFLSGHKGSKSHEENEKPVYDPKFHQTIIKSNSGLPVKTHTRLNTPKRGLYLDSLHFSNVYCRHKLEIMLRISKPDPECPSKLRHYEVLIDTPIFLLSEQCNSGNMELPTYDMATMEGKGNQVPLSMNSDFFGNTCPPPPTFEEAISVPASPIVSPMGSPNIMASYDPDLLSIQQLNLSRTTSVSGPSGYSDDAGVPNVNRNSISNANAMNGSISNSAFVSGNSGQGVARARATSVNDRSRFNNLDKLLSTPSPVNRSHNSSPTNGLSQANGTVRIPNATTENSKDKQNEFFKKGYTLANVKDNEEQEGIVSSSSADSLLSHGNEPPRYDEIVPLMSDEE
ncbi:CLL_collapsed_G0001090.mRNA.1.CDS.1 [Saccharomyces cerevisiae]|uniref:K7_Ecm21p n=1 Tax=Saccharomyces cerevisiae (strain Kyokai no. 7 / NBRC 101557) TaxID=721032 RepID=G2W8R3_YEASK|nr:Ecm21p [Saccharomyces cerevisiae YJM1311]AJQ14455.1 Ecm21p [Saccharomyces cerevisiae YJM1387]AJQ14840.1 Ecm21p [Saccharomyces cerevisiae YJM1388]CAI4245597.1 CLN_G0001180.mRNA.1.CDS.1 [Saccharomyces cerevisiae]GAA21456.1 K7_Ecm21p [Saccharomyces cerevisiae Kyokai no. 7]